MLDIQNLHVEVDSKPILKGLDLKVSEGETHALFGQNGSGKTTLVLTIMGFPRYHVTEGRILFKGGDITHLPVNERARLGIGISFQHPPAIHGVKLKDLVDIAAQHGKQTFKTEEVAETINIPPDFLTQYHPDYIIIMNPIYRDEIQEMSRQLGLHNGFLTAA